MRKGKFWNFLLILVKIGIFISLIYLIFKKLGCLCENEKVHVKKQCKINKLREKLRDLKYDCLAVIETLKDTIDLYFGTTYVPLNEDNYFEKEFH